MFKSIRSASTLITVTAVLILAICVTSCSTQPQLVGTWVDSSWVALVREASPDDTEWIEVWKFRSDNTFEMQGSGEGEGTYTVLDNGSIKIKFQNDGRTIIGKLENKKLIINWGKKQSVLKKYR